MIQRAFISHREAVLFQLIRTELRRVEYADGTGALAKVRPAEARLIADPALQARVRLRLGGSSFPPQVYYRVFTSGAHAHQLDGRQLELEPPSHGKRVMRALPFTAGKHQPEANPYNA